MGVNATFSLVNVTNDTCSSGYTERLHLDTDQMYGLVVLNTLGMLFGILSNITVICVIKNLSVRKNPSMMLMLMLAFSDMGVNLITVPLNISLYCTVIAKSYFCSLDVAMEFFAVFFGHSSAYITAIIGYDRLLRMTHLNAYSEVMSMWKVYSAVAGTAFLSLIHAGAQINSIWADNYGIVVLVGSIVDVVLMLLMMTPYLLLVRVIRRQRQRSNSVNNDILQDIDHLVNRIAFRIVFAVMVMYSPYVVLSAIRVLVSRTSPLRQDNTFRVMWCFSHDLTFASSCVNAIIFISINPTCKRKINQICTRRVVPSISP